MADESFPHLPLQREGPITAKRPRPGRGPRPPEDPASHGRALGERLEAAKAAAATDIGGSDDHLLFRFTVEKGFDPRDLLKVSNDIQVVSQEEDSVVIAFVNSAALNVFESRLASMADDGNVPYKKVLYALQGIDGWGEDDRKGWALKRDGLPADERFLLDIELWPLLEDESEKRSKTWQTFDQWLREKGITVVDKVMHPGLLLCRVRCTHKDAALLLRHKDIRTIDLPPRYGLDRSVLLMNIEKVPPIGTPPENAPGVVVLDSGLTTGHPLLAPAIGEAESFLEGKSPEDEHGHGTMVAGIALYGDLDVALQRGNIASRAHLFSGRILDESNQNESGLIENQITKAVHHFNKSYGCRIFNLSFGDQNKPYLEKHIKGLSYTLDVLSRELGVLFIVSAGNVSWSQLSSDAWLNQYPGYLTKSDWAIIEPAPSINALTVGSLARYDQTFNSKRWQQDLAEKPIAQRDQPSPFSRHGHSVGGAIKPELVAYGGNWAVNTRISDNSLAVTSGLGEVSTCREFMEGRLFASESGTSMAAPHVARHAAELLAEHPNAGPNLIRAILVAHAEVPEASKELFNNNPGAIRKICGYGQINADALTRSLENCVTLVADGKITNKMNHFYEIPIPNDFINGRRRVREITVAMAHTPFVRSTRVAYKATRMTFRAVSANHIDQVTTAFNQATTQEDYEPISELRGASVGSQIRERGTVQTSTWQYKQFDDRSILRRERLFVVATRNDYPWGEADSDREETYSLVVCLRDRENEDARLYTDIRNLLRARI